MGLKIQLPEDIERCLEERWGDLSRHTVESLAAEGYRSGILSRAQVRRMLGFETRAEVDAFMTRAGIPFDYGIYDFEHDAETSRLLSKLRAQELHRR